MKLFPENVWPFQEKPLPLHHPKFIVTMTKIIFKRLILRAMVWQAETPQCYTIRHRTPAARILFIPKIYRYVTFSNKC
jgi:hypothetical protein